MKPILLPGQIDLEGKEAPPPDGALFDARAYHGQLAPSLGIKIDNLRPERKYLPRCCDWCGKEFTPKDDSQICCSYECDEVIE